MRVIMAIGALRFKDGKLNDGANGEAAVQEFNDSGAIIRAVRFKDDKQIKVLSEQERDAYQAQTAFRNKLKVRSP